MRSDRVDVMPVHSSLDGPIESLSFLRRSLLFAELSKISLLVAGRGGAAGLSNRLPGNSLLRPRRRAGLHLRQRRRRGGRLPRHRAERLERRQGRPRPGDGDGRDGRLGPSRLQARSRRPLAAARAGARQQHADAVVHRATRSAARWRRFAPAAASFRTSGRIRGRCSRTAARASAIAAT